ELEPRVLGAGDANIGRRQQDVEPSPRGPAVDRRDDRLPTPRVMVAHASVDAGPLPVHGAGERPEDTLGAQVFALLGGDVLARRQIVATAEMPVASAGQDRAADLAVFPQIDPGGRDL